MSRLAAAQWRGFHPEDYAELIAAKRYWYGWLTERLSRVGGLTVLWPALPEGIVPFCVSCVVAARRDELLEQLRGRYDVMAWPTLPQAVLDRLEEFPEVDWLGRRLLQVLLPAERVRRPGFGRELEGLVAEVERFSARRRPGTRLEARWLTSREEFCAIAPEWDELVRASGSDNPFALSDFIIAWSLHASRGRALRIWTLRREGRLVAGLPLCAERRGGRRTLAHVGDAAANLTHVVSLAPDPRYLDALFSSLGALPGWDRLVLDRVLQAGAFSDQLVQASCGRAAMRLAMFPAGTNGLIDLAQGYEAVWRHLPERLRRYLRSGTRQAQSLGELTLRQISGRAQVQALFDRYCQLSIRSCRGRNRVSAFEDEATVRFFRELLERFDTKGYLDAQELAAGPCTLGISFGYRFGSGFKWILTAFNADVQRLRPGHLLLDALVKEAIRRGERSFDMFYGGEVQYKQQWCTTQMPLLRIEVARDTAVNRVAGSLERAVRANPSVLAAVRTVRDLALARGRASRRGA
jgi:CelD/BcsL family acetyltransferase involved in cellulose biosynthesis